MPDVTPAMLNAYFDTRDKQRQQEIAEAYPALERQMAGFIEAFADDEHLAAYLARMIRETAVAAFAHGVWQAGGGKADMLPDGRVFRDALHDLREFSDLYPAWRAFDARGLEEEDDE